MDDARSRFPCLPRPERDVADLLHLTPPVTPSGRRSSRRCLNKAPRPSFARSSPVPLAWVRRLPGALQHCPPFIRVFGVSRGSSFRLPPATSHPADRLHRRVRPTEGNFPPDDKHAEPPPRKRRRTLLGLLLVRHGPRRACKRPSPRCPARAQNGAHSRPR